MTPDPLLRLLNLPVAASAHAGEVDHILSLVHWLMLVLFVGWTVFFIYVLVRFRKRSNSQANYHGVRGRWSTWLEGGVLAAEIILLAFFSIPFWSTNVDAMPPEQGATRIRVVAEQFAWQVHYPGPDGVFGRTDISLVSPDNPLGLDRNEPAGKDDIVATNRMNLPVGKPVISHEQGRDSQLRSAADARQTGCDSRHHAAGMVHADADRDVGYRLFAAMRSRPLPHEGRVFDPDPGRFRRVPERGSVLSDQSLIDCQSGLSTVI